MQELSEEVLDLISIISETKDELEYISNSDWSVIESRKRRQKEYALQYKLTRTAVDNVKKLQSLGTDVEHPTVKDLLFHLISYYTLFAARVDTYAKQHYWRKYQEDENYSEKDVSEEMDLRSTILKNSISLKNDMTNVNAEEGSAVALELEKGFVAPLCMIDTVCKRHPHIRNIVKKKIPNAKL